MLFNFSYVFVGALTGFLVGLTGVGGGALMTPLLILFFGVIPTTAVATDLLFASITKLFGIIVYQKSGAIDWQIARRLWLGSIPMAMLVVTFVLFGGTVFKINWLSHVIAVVLMITGFGMFAAPRLYDLAKKKRLRNPVEFKSFQPIMTVISGVVLGGVVSFTSVGAGALGCVMLLYLYPLRLTPHRLIATDIAHAIPLALLSGLVYLYFGVVNITILVNMLIGSIPAILLGSLFAKKIPGRLIQILLAIILTLTGFKMIY